MRKIQFIGLVISFVVILYGCKNTDPKVIFLNNGNSHETYFSVHKIKEAWKFGTGKNINVGILDHLFNEKENKVIYQKSINFIKNSYQDISGHGYWLSRTLKETAPDCNIYALTTYSSDETEMVNAMMSAIDWGIKNGIDIFTYSQPRISVENRIKIDQKIKEAYEHNIVIIFLHDPSPYNILPSEIEPKIENENNNPKINIWKYDYSVIQKQIVGNKNMIIDQDDFVSISSKPVVLAGIIAILKEEKPDISVEKILDVLIETSYDYESKDYYLVNTINAYEAAKTVSLMP